MSNRCPLNKFDRFVFVLAATINKLLGNIHLRSLCSFSRLFLGLPPVESVVLPGRGIILVEPLRDVGSHPRPLLHPPLLLLHIYHGHSAIGKASSAAAGAGRVVPGEEKSEFTNERDNNSAF